MKELKGRKRTIVLVAMLILNASAVYPKNNNFGIDHIFGPFGWLQHFALKNAVPIIALELPEQGLGEVQNIKSAVDVSSFSVCNVFESVDLSYELESSLLTGNVMPKEDTLYCVHIFQKWKVARSTKEVEC